MDKAAAMRARLIEQVSRMLERPGMFATHDQDFEFMCQMRLEDLRFLDGLPELTRDELGLSNKYRSCGVPGPFREAFGDRARYYNEVASVYAEIFHRYGYLAINRLVSDTEWTTLLAATDSAYNDVDIRLSEIVGAFGPPSFKIGKRLLCYAPENGTGWVFVDGFVFTPDDHGAPRTLISRNPTTPYSAASAFRGPISGPACASARAVRPCDTAPTWNGSPEHVAQ
jgi:hypothetical protein